MVTRDQTTVINKEIVNIRQDFDIASASYLEAERRLAKGAGATPNDYRDLRLQLEGALIALDDARDVLLKHRRANDLKYFTASS
jgi:hypothetical protein